MLVMLDKKSSLRRWPAKAHVSELKHYKLSRFSSERLLHFITLLNRDVEILIRPRTGAAASNYAAGSVMVWAAA